MVHSMRLAALGCSVMVLAMSSGCATILGGGGTQPVVISGPPSGSHVEIVNSAGVIVHSGVTPFTVTLSRGQGYFAPAVYTVRVTDANGPRELKLHGTINPWYFGNLVFGGLVGCVVVDPLTGAMWWLPKELHVDDVRPHLARGLTDPPPQAVGPARPPAVAQSTGVN